MNEASRIAADACAKQLALESLREGDVPRALEFLEMGLDENILRLDSVAKEGSLPQREQALSALRMIRDYRQTHPRRVEADLSNLASGLPARAGREAQQRVRQILDEIV